MFTGLISQTGKVTKRSGPSLEVDAQLANFVEGDSVSVNGVCLTVTRITSDHFEVHLSEETLARSALGEAKPGDRVNLEVPLRLGDPLDGHMVQGHVDGTGVVTDVTERQGSVEMSIELSAELMKYIVVKGSVAVDGVSLTVTEVHRTGFSVSLIPHTLSSTNLSDRMAGDRVNIEADILAKYIERLTTRRAEDP